VRLDDLDEEELLQQAAQRAMTVAYTPEGEVEAEPIAGSVPPERVPLPALQRERIVAVDLPAQQAGVKPQNRISQVQTAVAPKPQAGDDLELAMAKAEDRRARQRMAMERGSRELVAGLTRTAPQSTIAQPTDAVKQLLALRAQQRANETAAGNRQMGERKLTFAEQEAKRKADAAEQERIRKGERRTFEDERHDKERAENKDLAERRLDASRDNASANRELARAGLSIRQDEADVKREDRADKQAAGAIPLFDSSFSLAPGLSDSERGKAREVAGLWNAADSATGELERALQAYVANPSRATAAAAQSAVATASTSLNAALGQGAMAEAEARRMQETLGADLFSPAGAQAVVESLAGDPKAGSLLLTRLRSAREANRAAARGRLRTYASGGGTTPRTEDRAKSMSDQDYAALQWAKQHPDDLRSRQILDRLGAGL
jgi:hypothetical protein